MEILNQIVLLTISIVGLICLIKEMEVDDHTTKEIVSKIIFGGISVGALLAVFYDSNLYYFIMNSCFLIILIDRLRNIKGKTTIKE